MTVRPQTRIPLMAAAVALALVTAPSLDVQAQSSKPAVQPRPAPAQQQRGFFGRMRSLRPTTTFIKTHQSKITAAAKKAGGHLELHREGNHRLLVNDKGKLAYQRTDTKNASIKTVGMSAFFPHSKFPTLKHEKVLSKLAEHLVWKDPKAKPKKPAADKPMAVLPDGKKIKPTTWSGGFHGTTEVTPEVAFKKGLPGRGNDWRLKEHSESAGNSAFRGTTQVVYDPVSGNGAAAWAGKDGWVYDIRGVPGWDVNATLQGRVKVAGGGFRGNLMYGEQETAIPAAIPKERIKAAGKVVEDSQGRLRVTEWIPNPHYVNKSAKK